eukprot:gnl/TRDRNA2_/TRDRNA2_169823_c3_seq2.p1 gnl/TRDRNA2_/TRDRNA2_169823_c3~~gnl/TRDRNA2_/TRDRNA2_169823_c3_seq2.p1  ORF type:complete len:434 (-),score=24.48 gnl/TRDRNA2_/TRDRNA2_169823_c3_seq2:12-1139(-)
MAGACSSEGHQALSMLQTKASVRRASRAAAVNHTVDLHSVIQNIGGIYLHDLSAHSEGTWTRVLSTTQKNNMQALLPRSVSLLTTLAGKSKSKACVDIGQPGFGEIFMSCTDNEICLAGRGYAARADSTISMITEAVNSLHQDGVRIRNFDKRKIHIADQATCDYDYAYALPWNTVENCKTQLFPDFTLHAWPEAGLLPNFTSLTNTLHDISRNPAEKQICGWAGNPMTNDRCREFVRLAPPSLFEVITPSSNIGTGGDRITMELQIQKWACVVDLPGRGYSGRVPMLLHTGRPLLMLERDRAGHFTDRVWYADMLKPDLHYIPVNYNFSNLEDAAKKALSEEGRHIAGRAQRLAAERLTRVAAIQYIATLLTPG